MGDSGATLYLGAITIIVGCLFSIIAVKLNKAAQRRSGTKGLSRLTLSGTTVFAVLTGFWIVCLVAYTLKPSSLLGAFVGTIDGVVVLVLATIVFVLSAEIILKKLGYPIVRNDDGRPTPR